jgi:hypothetical protein
MTEIERLRKQEAALLERMGAIQKAIQAEYSGCMDQRLYQARLKAEGLDRLYLNNQIAIKQALKELR